ncbi:hypothetical protein ACTXT7_017433 [Hymenolepis weldensis]
MLSNALYKSFNKTVERRTDFDMKATEPAEVVDDVCDVGEEVDCEGLDGEAGVDGVVAAVDVVVVGVTVVELEAVVWSALPKTTTINSRRKSERHI